MKYQITKKHAITLPDDFVRQYTEDFCEPDDWYLFLYVAASLEKYTETELDEEMDRHSVEEMDLYVLNLLKDEYSIREDMSRLWDEAVAAGEIV